MSSPLSSDESEDIHPSQILKTKRIFKQDFATRKAAYTQALRLRELRESQIRALSSRLSSKVYAESFAVMQCSADGSTEVLPVLAIAMPVEKSRANQDFVPSNDQQVVGSPQSEISVNTDQVRYVQLLLVISNFNFWVIGVFAK